MSLKANEGRAKQWTFTIPSFDNDTINRLSTLPPNVTYCAFAIMEDDTGNPFIEGYIKMNSRCRVSALIRLVGYGFFDTCSIHTDVPEILLELKASKSFLEFGNKKEIQTQGTRKDLESFKEAVEANLTKKQLEVLYPEIFIRFPCYAHRLLSQTQLPLEDKCRLDEWIKVGRPKGLPWLVYKAWKKGKTYEHPNPNKSEAPTHLRDAGKGLARKVYTSWIKGEIYLAS